MRLLNFIYTCLPFAYLVANDFPQNSFQRISVIFYVLVTDVLNIAFSTVDLLYNRIIPYNKTISPLVIFIFTDVTFVVDAIGHWNLPRFRS